METVCKAHMIKQMTEINLYIHDNGIDLQVTNDKETVQKTNIAIEKISRNDKWIVLKDTH